jgi:tRNA(Arg) A34 adenosine deaminase TadA
MIGSTTVTTMKRHEHLIKKAVKVAQSSTYFWKHGAVVAKGNKVLGWAPNKKRNFSAFDSPGDHYTDHAERATIRELLKIREDLRGCTIYIARINKAGKTMLSRPCAGCMEAIVAAGIKEIVYTNEFGTYSIERVELTSLQINW